MNNKCNIIFLLGIEGTGHHMYKECCNLKENKKLHKLLLKYTSINKNNDLQKIKKEIYSFTKNKLNKCFINRASFPYDRPTTPIQSYDILSLYELFSTINHVNFFFIINTRNIIYSTLSTHNRFDSHKNILWSSRLQENCLIYINSQIQLLPKEKFIIVDFLNCIQNIELFQKIIYEKSKIIISFNKKKINTPNDLKYLNDKNYLFLYNFFNNNRLKQFNFINNNKYIF